MPILGPSLLFVAGLTLGASAGVLYPRKPTPSDLPIPPSPPEGSRRDAVGPVSTAGSSVVVQGGFPGKFQPSV